MEKKTFAESFKFKRIRQKAGESIVTYALRLRQAAKYCYFVSFLDRMLTGRQSGAHKEDVQIYYKPNH